MLYGRPREGVATPLCARVRLLESRRGMFRVKAMGHGFWWGLEANYGMLLVLFLSHLYNAVRGHKKCSSQKASQ